MMENSLCKINLLYLLVAFLIRQSNGSLGSTPETVILLIRSQRWTGARTFVLR